MRLRLRLACQGLVGVLFAVGACRRSMPSLAGSWASQTPGTAGVTTPIVTRPYDVPLSYSLTVAGETPTTARITLHAESYFHCEGTAQRAMVDGQPTLTVGPQGLACYGLGQQDWTPPVGGRCFYTNVTEARIGGDPAVGLSVGPLRLYRATPSGYCSRVIAQTVDAHPLSVVRRP